MGTRASFPIELGPYRLNIRLRPSATMLDRRRLGCVAAGRLCIELRQELSGLRLFSGPAFWLPDPSVSRGVVAVSKAVSKRPIRTASPPGWWNSRSARSEPGWRFNLLLSEHLPGDLRATTAPSRRYRRAHHFDPSAFDEVPVTVR